MAIADFPPVESADEHGLLALGGDLEVDSLLLAYSRGIFPWPISEEYPLAWFSPNPRGILAFEKLHISKSLKKFLKANPFEIKFNTNFEQVIMNCAMVARADNQGTWITQEIIDSYVRLHKEGYAYSVETYLDGNLVGGVYGVCINRFYSGESMFHKADNASKVALIALLYSLNQQNIGWLDTQMVTPVVESLGGIEIPRETYLKMLEVAIKRPV
ncbi:MAG: leucyl/phenylalanyl-tRNA--protein transferase [Rhizobacter sp.]|nr:leucyl/phenylalanyl-tRNA--protein transferase [Bacteriovorax sp.]